MLEHLDVQGLVANQLVRPSVLILHTLHPFGFRTLHSAILGALPLERGLADRQGLKHRGKILTCVEHCVCITSLAAIPRDGACLSFPSSKLCSPAG